MKAVASRENPTFKAMAKLVASGSERRRRGASVLDGAHLLAAFLDSGRKPEAVLVSRAGLEDREIARLVERSRPAPVTMLSDALFGALSITSDLRSGMIRPTFLATPDRRRVLIAKLVVSAVGGAALGLLAEGLALGLGSALLAARGMPVRLEGSDYAQLLIGGVLAGALWGPLGLGLGALFRNQVATLIGLCAWLLFVENVLLGQMPEIIRYFPDAVSSAIAGATVTGEVPSNPPLLAPITGAFVLTAYTIAANLAGMVAMVRRDIP